MNIFENLGEAIQKTIQENAKKIDIKNTNISENEVELATKLDAIEEFTVDRFEEDIVVLENRKTGKMTDIKKEELPQEIKTGDIIKRINGKYFIDNEQTQEVAKRIENKMNNLWK